jgi:GTP diphosphokinase / guanosine-3',5'-bis(diphosphate) 3'-diphosphatase
LLRSLAAAVAASNLNSLISSPPVEWTTERRLAYVEWCRTVVAGLRGTNTMLEELFDEVR